jgi:hypothetical protein
MAQVRILDNKPNRFYESSVFLEIMECCELLRFVISKVKKKAIPVIGRGGLQGCEKLRIPNCLDNRFIDGSEVVSLMREPRSTRQKHFFYLWYSFLLETE